MEKIKVGLIGLGTVGSGVVKTIRNFPNIVIEKIAVKNINKKRNIENLDESLLTTDAFEIVNNPDIDIVIEVIGGCNPALDLLKTAIKNKKHIVTANKELLAKHGEEIFSLANENNVAILYEAAIGGGIPIIMPIKTTLSCNKINKVAAILNGTTNYILTKMDEDNADYNDVLLEAQKLGYAETDPTGDVEGYDAAYKIATLATLAFNKRVNIDKIYREGIVKLTAGDIKAAHELGYKIKLIALAQLTNDDKADVRVHPMMVPVHHPLASVSNVTNAVMLSGKPVGDIMLTGPGAGEFPTASSVMGDLLSLISEIKTCDTPLPMMRCHHEENAEQLDIEETENKYYLSINAANTPGVIGLIGNACKENDINLESIIQKGTSDNGSAEVVVVTARCKEKNIRNVILSFEDNEFINRITSCIRVME